MSMSSDGSFYFVFLETSEWFCLKSSQSENIFLENNPKDLMKIDTYLLKIFMAASKKQWHPNTHTKS